MIDPELILPTALVAVSVLLKMSIGRTVNPAVVAESFHELPAELSSLGVSFTISLAILIPAEVAKGLMFFAGYMVVWILTILLWRITRRLFDRNRLVLATGVTIVNFGLSLGALMEVVQLLQEVQK